MTLVEKTVWLIESRLGSETSLAGIAAAAGVSRFHLSRAFGMAAGRSVMGYVRARRLSLAASRLKAGAPDILTVALEAGYGSHEAFTRAFRTQFDTTPEAVRAQGHVESSKLVEPLVLDFDDHAELMAPRFEIGETCLIAGLGEHYTFGSNHGIPFQWQRFRPYLGNVARQIGRKTFGVCCNADHAGHFEYIAGAAVSDFGDVPCELSRVRIPGRTYAVFTHRDHVSALRRTVHTIWSRWLPASGYQPADSPDFELYDEAFDPLSGVGGVEVWLPVDPVK